jgi:hypothetical protein
MKGKKRRGLRVRISPALNSEARGQILLLKKKALKRPLILKKRCSTRVFPLLVSKGSNASAARSMVGKWRKSAGDGVISGLISQAIEKNITDPGPWILAGLNRAANDTSAFYASINRTFGGSVPPGTNSSAPEALRT